VLHHGAGGPRLTWGTVSEEEAAAAAAAAAVEAAEERRLRQALAEAAAERPDHASGMAAAWLDPQNNLGNIGVDILQVADAAAKRASGAGRGAPERCCTFCGRDVNPRASLL
jgi:hypothetical protein